jgi:allantoate deiminase
MNVVPGWARASLDVRHAENDTRTASVQRLLSDARAIAARRGLEVKVDVHLEQASVAMDRPLTESLARAVERSGSPVHLMPSGAGHDAMILASSMPVAMLFIRNPGGVSHHPDEDVRAEDVAAALAAGRELVRHLAGHV